MKTVYRLVFFVAFTALAGCRKQQFFEDPNNPGLSRFTSRNYNVMSAYINAKPWVSGFSALQGPQPMQVQLVSSSALKDTLHLSWSGRFTDADVLQPAGWPNYEYLHICIPVNKNFSADDFIKWNGRSFATDTVPVRIVLSPFGFQVPNASLSGKGNIYLVKVGAENNGQGSAGFTTSGLFEGNIGDSIRITKGRFDYQVLPENHNLK